VRVEIVKVCNGGGGESSSTGRENGGGAAIRSLVPDVSPAAAAANLSYGGIGTPVENNKYIYICVYEAKRVGGARCDDVGRAAVR